MRMILLAGVALLAACGGGETETNDANLMMDANAMMDPNMMMSDPNMMMTDPNMMGANTMGGMNGMTTNGTVDANTQQMMQKDATTNDPDTNLANGV